MPDQNKERIVIMIRENGYLLCSHKFSRFFWVIPLLLLLPSVSLMAAEGTAHLTFQKAAPGNDNKQAYIIRSGDSISRIVQKLGWTTPRYKMIRRLNPHITDLNRIYPGQKLILTLPGEKSGTQEVGNYTAKEGDSITSIIISELNTSPSEAVKILRLIKQLNPEVNDFNKIYPGQVIKIPRSKLSPSVPAKSSEDKKALAMPPPATEKYLYVLRQVIEQLYGKVITSGNHYIPLPESGQIIVDRAIVPVVELEDGTTIMLDHAGRMPDVLADIIQSNGKNYHVVKIVSGQSIASVLQKIILLSSSLQMVKVEKPLSFDNTPQGKLSLDWLITKKSLSGSAFYQLGLLFAADKSKMRPSAPIVNCALKKGINVCEILEDKVRINILDPAQIRPLR
jgi:LysM repeat protein